MSGFLSLFVHALIHFTHADSLWEMALTLLTPSLLRSSLKKSPAFARSGPSRPGTHVVGPVEGLFA